MIRRAFEKKNVARKQRRTGVQYLTPSTIEHHTAENEQLVINEKEIVVISGKGGTGKTSLVAAFCAIEKNMGISSKS